MRLRKKHNVADKLREFNDIVLFSNDDWRSNILNKKIHVELGTGKGDFISRLAEQNPDIYFIGLEVEATVVYVAARKIREKGLKNVHLLIFDINNIEELFDENEIDQLYINFCDPWPKKRHAKRRLTHIRFLDKYKRLLKSDGEIQFKTDNRGLFDFSLEQFNLANCKVSEVTYDLHSEQLVNNIETEYERKFTELGVPICRCIVKF